MIDSVLQGYPIPELYMSDKVDSNGDELHTVIDGQQRIRACLDFVEGRFKLLGDDIQSVWRGLKFDDLSVPQKQALFSYKFVVRVLPAMGDVELRKIFARLNRNVVALNEQELRNATYWGNFISTVQEMADEDEFWSEFGIFTAKDHRRMLDHEYISELVAAYLHGPQNKKDKLDDTYRKYESEFERADEVKRHFRATTGEIRSIFSGTDPGRWKKKSDFYTLFLTLIKNAHEFPWPSDKRATIGGALLKFGDDVTKLLLLDEPVRSGSAESNVLEYARAVARAASDKQNRIDRETALANALGL